MLPRGLSSTLERTRDAASEARMLVRLARDLPDFLGTPITASQSLERVRARVGQREHAFLATVERTVFGHPRSPYLRLLRHVGCERGDFRALVRREGVEGALSSLATQGVYVTFDELKGRRPIVRGSLSFHPSDRDFDAPFVYGHYLTFTGGTRGRPARVPRPLPFVEELATSYGASLAAHGIEHARTTYWLSNPVTTMLFAMKLGQAPELWLHPIAYRAARARFGAGYLRLLGRLNGRPIPRPRLLVAGEARRLARWLNHRSSDGRPTIVHTVPSSAVRVAVAAGEDGIELGGVTFFLQSEPLTEARRRHVETSGAGVIATYTSIEASVVGLTCASPSAADDYHLMADRFALVTREREAVAGGPTVPALLVSTLTDTVPKVCFNAELGDYARVEQRACGCMFGTLGLTTHLFEVRSFEKLSGEGVTFARSNALRILEETLPARFGGTALDYQLVEEEGSDSATRLILRVSPSVGRVDEDVLKGALLVELGQGGLVDRHHAELLRRAGSVAIVREPPLATQAGKVLPFQLQRAQRAPGHAPR